MNKKAIYGILLTVLLPLIGYIYLKNATESAAPMPRHFIPDSVVTRTKNGKEYNDQPQYTIHGVLTHQHHHCAEQCKCR